MLNISVKHRVVGLAVTSAAIAAGSGWAVAGATGDPGAELRTALAGTEPTAAVGELQPAIVEHFALFREKPAAVMPDDAKQQIGSASRYGRDASLARAIKTVTGTGWVIPGDGYLCIAVPDPIDGYGTSCLPTEVAVRQGLALTLSGNMPNGKAAETLLVADGSRVLQGPAGREQSVDGHLGVVSVFTDKAGQLRAAGR